MRQQPITDESWTEAEAMRLVRGLRGRHRSQDGGDTRAVLARTVEDQVIPRLLLAQRPQKIARAAGDIAKPQPEQVADLVALVLAGSPSRTTEFVAAIRDGGLPTETIMLDLLAPTARELGRLWEEDEANFAEVTIGLVRLSNVMRLLTPAFAGDAKPLPSAPHVLLAQMPGEQHGFGLDMVVQFFRRAGWNVRQHSAPAREDLVAIVQHGWFGLVGLSVSCSDRLDSLAADIRAIRRHSSNPRIGVLVGGPPFIAHPQLASMVGADATAVDARQAVQQAQGLMSLQAQER